MGRNFGKHAANAQAARAASGVKEQVPESSLRPKRPAGFLKLPDTVRGPGEPIIYPSRTRKLDYEVELALIIGKEGKDIPAEEAMSYACGYSIFCDYSARDQTTDLEDMQWVRQRHDHGINFGVRQQVVPVVRPVRNLPPVRKDAQARLFATSDGLDARTRHRPNLRKVKLVCNAARADDPEGDGHWLRAPLSGSCRSDPYAFQCAAENRRRKPNARLSTPSKSVSGDQLVRRATGGSDRFAG